MGVVPGHFTTSRYCRVLPIKGKEIQQIIHILNRTTLLKQLMPERQIERQAKSCCCWLWRGIIDNL
jgi:hypothetical protein